MRIILSAALCAVLFLTPSSPAGVNGKSVPLQNPNNRSSPVRYVIVSNEVIGGGNPKDAFRYVEVLLDEKTFNEETLRDLFKLLSKRFPTPSAMDVSVSTSLEQVDTPEEREAGKISEAPANPAADRYPSALLIRKEGNELFRYTPNAPDTEMKTVVIKGRDPQTPKRSPFHHVIVSNDVIDDSGQPPRDAYRYVEVFLDDKAFSESNLKELFKRVSKRFPNPQVLNVLVYTNPKDIETTEERARPKMSEMKYDPSLDKYHQAFFLRDNDGKESFTYNPTPPSTSTKKIVLKER